MWKCLIFVFFASCYGQFKCPQRTGFFPDLQECDVYYICSRGTYEQKFCPEGLVFDDKDPNQERCETPANIDCGDRTILQEARSSPGCPKANGFFRHPTDCTKFHNCEDGIPTQLSCPPGLVYDDDTSNCVWPKSSKRSECFQPTKDVLDDGFQCPGGDTEGPNGRTLPHPTFAHPDDCQKFYICRDGVSPQKGSCSPGTVYNEDTFTCDEPANVPGCEDYYSGKAGKKKSK